MTPEPPIGAVERELQRAYAVVPSEALRRRIDARVGRVLAAAPAGHRRQRWALIALLAGAVALLGAGFYVALQQPVASSLDPGQPLSCTGLVGGTPEAAAAELANRGYHVVWTRETTDAEDARLGFAERVDRMPAGVVLDITVRGQEAEVRVTPADDPLSATAVRRADAEQSSCP